MADLDQQTTSVLEAMHSVIQWSFHPNPHIYKLIDDLKLHEAKKATDLYRVSKGDEIQQKRAEDKKRAEKIKECLENLKNGDISVAKFLDLMSNSCPIATEKKLPSEAHGWYYYIEVSVFTGFLIDFFYR